MLALIVPCEGTPPSIARLADLQERIRGAEQRATQIRDQVITLSRSIVDQREVEKAMAIFDPVWDSLTLREQVRVIQLLVERVDYDGSTGKIAITFHSSGIKTLADELAGESEDAA